MKKKRQMPLKGVKPEMIERFIDFVSTGQLDETTRVLLNVIFSRESVPECQALYHLPAIEKRNLYFLWDFLDKTNRDHIK